MSSCGTTAAPGKVAIEDKIAAKGYLIGDPVDRIRDHRIRGWSYLSDRHVIVNAGIREDYLITLRNACPDLSFTSSIGFTETVGSVTRSDAILVRGGGGILDRCYIYSIVRLEKPKKENS